MGSFQVSNKEGTWNKSTMCKYVLVLGSGDVYKNPFMQISRMEKNYSEVYNKIYSAYRIMAWMFTTLIPANPHTEPYKYQKF